MARKPAAKEIPEKATTAQLRIVANRTGPADYQPFDIWIVGDMPLICHAWSKKAKDMMLGKQVGATKAGRAIREPEKDFESSLYDMGNGFGFPATGIKKCLLAGAHKDKNVAKTDATKGLWINGDMTRLMPARAGAICDLPLIRIWGSEPEMREDMVRVGTGMSKTSTLAYRAQFTVWAMNVHGRYNPSLLNPEKLMTLINDGGYGCGIGEWRCERSGDFGSFHLADVKEAEAWDKFRAGKGPLPIPANHYLEAAE